MPKKTATEAESPALIPQNWTVITTPVHRKGLIISVHHLCYNSAIVHTAEGKMAAKSLQDLADRYNSERTRLTTHKTCFADISGEGARSKLMVKKA